MSTNAPKAVTLVTMPGSFMPGCRSSSFVDALGEGEGLELLARVAAGLGQLGHDVVQRRQADRVGNVSLQLDLLAQRPASCIRSLTVQPRSPAMLLDDRVAFRMHGAGVERVAAVADAQEAGRLLEGLGAQPRDLHAVLRAT